MVEVRTRFKRRIGSSRAPNLFFELGLFIVSLLLRIVDFYFELLVSYFVLVGRRFSQPHYRQGLCVQVASARKPLVIDNLNRFLRLQG